MLLYDYIDQVALWLGGLLVALLIFIVVFAWFFSSN
jgi:hypothetical protein